MLPHSVRTSVELFLYDFPIIHPPTSKIISDFLNFCNLAKCPSRCLLPRITIVLLLYFGFILSGDMFYARYILLHLACKQGLALDTAIEYFISLKSRM